MADLLLCSQRIKLDFKNYKNVVDRISVFFRSRQDDKCLVGFYFLQLISIYFSKTTPQNDTFLAYSVRVGLLEVSIGIFKNKKIRISQKALRKTALSGYIV